MTTPSISFNVGHRVLIPRGVCVRTGISTRPVFWVRMSYKVRIVKVIPSAPRMVVNDVLEIPAVGRCICWWSSNNLYHAAIDEIVSLMPKDTRRVVYCDRSVPRDLAMLALMMGGNDYY